MKLSDLVESLKTGLEKVEGASELLGQVNELATVAQQYDDLDPTEARTAITELSRVRSDAEATIALKDERDTLHTQLQETQATIGGLRKQLMSVRAMGNAGVNPNYEDLLSPVVSKAIELDDAGNASLPDGFFEGLKEKYPAAFYAEDAGGTGGSANGTPGTTDQPATYSVGSDRVISGVDPDAVLSGKVQISEG